MTEDDIRDIAIRIVDLTEDDIRDIAIRIVDQMVFEGIIPDCTDTNNTIEFDTQDIIVEQLTKVLTTNEVNND